MELFVEKEFLDNFCIEFDEKDPSIGQKVVASIFEEYGDIEWFIDTEINSPEEFEELERSYYFFAKRSNYKPPTGVLCLEEALFNISSFQQTIVFAAYEKEWFKKAEARGVLCLTYENFEQKLLEIINTCPLKIDLSEPFSNWEPLSCLSGLPFNLLLINDNYILTDKKEQSMHKNIISLLKNLLEEKREQQIKIDIYTKDLNPDKPGGNVQVAEALEKRYRKLNSSLANYKKKFRIINNDLQRDYYDLHDRNILTNFFIVDSGKGFNLFPGKKSNSQIVVETIFDKLAYKRMKNLSKMYNDYLDRFQHRETLKFSVYPPENN